MKIFTIPVILERLQGYLNQDYDFDDFRKLICARYESEDDIYVENEADDVLSVLAPYIETEEAIPDNRRDIRLRRLCKLLKNRGDLPASAVTVFGLKYEEIVQLVKKKDDGIITEAVLRQQVRELTPATFDLDSVLVWAEKQKGDEAV